MKSDKIIVRMWIPAHTVMEKPRNYPNPVPTGKQASVIYDCVRCRRTNERVGVGNAWRPPGAE
ncbi:hypothetical protein [Streptosporangium sp. NPDC002607]